MNNKDNKKWKIIQVVFFLLLLCAGTGAVVFGACDGRTYSELEKRELAAFPEVDAGSIFSGEFEKDFTEALSDHTWGRDLFVTAKTAVQVLLGRTEIDNIFIDGERLIELYHDSDFDDKQISSNVSDLTGFLATASKGIGTEHVKLMLVPSKYSLYRDRLPSYVPVSKRADSLAGEIREELSEKLVQGMAAADEDASDEEEDADTDENIGDDMGFDFDEGDPDAEDDSDENIGDDMGFDFDEGDPDAEGDSSESEEDESDSEEDADEPAATEEASAVPDNAPADADTSAMTDEEKAAQAQAAAEQMVIDLRPILASHASEYIFYLTDHHWTTLGAAYAYDAYRSQGAAVSSGAVSAEGARQVADDFLGTDYNKIHYYKKEDAINRYPIPEADAATMEINDSGDLSKRDGIYDEEALQTADKYNYFFTGNYSAITVNTTAKTDKTLLIVKDSYSNSLVPFLCGDYKKIIMVDLRYVNASIYDYLPDGAMPDDVLVVYNEEKFMQDTHQLYLR